MNISQDLPKGLMDIKYSEEKLHNLAKKLNWSGSGVENDPYIIPSNAGLPQEFATVQSKLFINIKNNTFENVDFYRCWNTTVENSSFNKITFLYSFMNTFRLLT